MTRDQAMLLAVGALAVVCLALLVTCLRLRAATARHTAELAAVRKRLDELDDHGEHTQLGTMTSSAPAPTSAAAASAPVEFLITDLGRERPASEPVRLDGPTFADIVLKETVVKAASLAHGVRRGLAPATRNRIRFEMRQEVRRSRKQRRRDLKAARRYQQPEAS